MIKSTSILLVMFGLLMTIGIIGFVRWQKDEDERFVSFIVDPRKQDLQFFWKDEKQQNFRSILNLKNWLDKQHKRLDFAMNAGMYRQDYTPLGLFIENKKTITALNKAAGNGNFYLKPNGVFYINTKDSAGICLSTDFVDTGNIKYATQSGPMLLIDGQIHPAFNQGSANRNIRNGVGILPDNRIIFAMSKKEINFYDFADYFKKLGCGNALYLDGFVSRAYLPAQNWTQTDGDFGVIIAVSTNLK